MPEKPVRRRRARQPERSTRTAKPRKQPGLRYKQPDLVGKHLFRVREVHVRDHLVPLLSKNRLGAAKLDLILRGLALLPQHTGKRSTPGLVLNRFTYEDLHDLARPANWFGGKSGDPYAYDPDLARLKRKWVGEQLQELEAMKLIRRDPRPGDHPTIVVLRDDGSRKAFDDPDGTPGKTYVSILGGIISSGALAEWNMARLTFYLAAMIAEWHTVRLPVQLPANILELLPDLAVRGTEPGGGRWYRPLTWFNDATQHEDNAVLIPFSTSTLERGLKAFQADGLVEVRKLRRNPRTHKPFKSGPRNLYINKFSTLTEAARIVPAEQFDDELKRLIAEQSRQS
jgi:hypothetical protein